MTGELHRRLVPDEPLPGGPAAGPAPGGPARSRAAQLSGDGQLGGEVAEEPAVRVRGGPQGVGRRALERVQRVDLDHHAVAGDLPAPVPRDAAVEDDDAVEPPPAGPQVVVARRQDQVLAVRVADQVLVVGLQQVDGGRRRAVVVRGRLEPERAAVEATLARRSPTASSPRRTSATVRLAQARRSWTVAGPWLAKNRWTSSARAASGSAASAASAGGAGGTRASSSAYECCRPIRGPLQTTPSSSAP
jgi:hypothetical protein